MSKLALDGGTPVRDKFLIFGAPCFGEEEVKEVVATMESGWIGTGPKTEQFEREFAEYVGAPNAVGVNSCTAALHLSLLVAGVGEGDEVITSPLTFAATVNVIEHVRARPVFVDIDEETLNIDPAGIERVVSAKTKAVLPVHFGGLAADLDAIRDVTNGATIIEDAAHAVGSRYKGYRIGASGNPTCFSFYANKNITTAEGGMITFADSEIRPRLDALRMHGMNRDAWNRYRNQGLVHNEVVEPGYKYNLTDLQSSMGIHQLRKLEGFLTRREELAARYDVSFRRLDGVALQPRPTNIETDRHGLHLYVLVLDPAQFSVDRDRVVAALRAENVGAAIHYRAVHHETYYRERYPAYDDALPSAVRVSENILSLPLTPGMTDADADDAIEAVEKVLEAYRR